MATESEGATVIIDDAKARKFAIQLGLKYTGTLGILIKAKQSKLITSLKEVLVEIDNTNFRISENLKEIVLKQVGEM